MPHQNLGLSTPGAKAVLRRMKTKEQEQSKRFIETARKLGVDETEAGHERAFGKVGLKKPKEKKTAHNRQAD